MKNTYTARLNPLVLICLGGLLFASFSQMYDEYSLLRLQQDPLDLDVPPIVQSRGTSCGEAAITMAYNYAYPQTQISEQEVINYATANGYFTEDLAPFTSPANMVKIARHYANDVSSGTVSNPDQGLRLLIQKLENGEPVIIDVLTRFDDPQSEAHFVVITGISVDPDNNNAIVITYNDPLTGQKKSAVWAGSQGVWNAWQNTGDPGGSGWWMVISTP